MVEVEEVTKDSGDVRAGEDEPEMASKDKKDAARAEWVRGFSHVLPIDHEMTKFKGPIEKLKSLIDEEKYDVNERDQAMGLTPLMKAASRGYVEAIELLLDRGADPDLKDNTGKTALHKCWAQYPECKELLLKRGATKFPWPVKNHFHYKFKGYGESYWEEMDDPDAPEDVEKAPLSEPKYWTGSFAKAEGTPYTPPAA